MACSRAGTGPGQPRGQRQDRGLERDAGQQQLALQPVAFAKRLSHAQPDVMARSGADHHLDHAHGLTTQPRIIVDRVVTVGGRRRAWQGFGQVAIQTPTLGIDYLAMHFVGGVPAEHARDGWGDLDRSTTILHRHQLGQRHRRIQQPAVVDLAGIEPGQRK